MPLLEITFPPIRGLVLLVHCLIGSSCTVVKLCRLPVPDMKLSRTFLML